MTDGNWIVGGHDSSGSGGGRPRFDWAGIDRDLRESARQDDHGARAPRVPGYGLTAQELHDYQRTFTEYAAARLLTVGADQYDEGESQKFEDMDLIKLATGLREELADVVNYAVMLDIRLTRIADRWDTLRKVSGHGVSE